MVLKVDIYMYVYNAIKIITDGINIIIICTWRGEVIHEDQRTSCERNQETITIMHRVLETPVI